VAALTRSVPTRARVSASSAGSSFPDPQRGVQKHRVVIGSSRSRSHLRGSLARTATSTGRFRAAVEDAVDSQLRDGDRPCCGRPRCGRGCDRHADVATRSDRDDANRPIHPGAESR
jgi:hypothetical protein